MHQRSSTCAPDRRQSRVTPDRFPTTERAAQLEAK